MPKSDLSNTAKGSFYSALNEGDGYFHIREALTPRELCRVREIVRDQWLRHIAEVAPKQVSRFSKVGMEQYHLFSHLLNHHEIWPKRERTLSLEALQEIRTMSLFNILEAEFGRFAIADVEHNGWEEIYWRLVRPNETRDVGPLHADKWFWDILKQPMPPNTERIKVWVAICCEPGLSGLKIAPGTHRHHYPYHEELRDGIRKPKIDVPDNHFNMKLFDSSPGDAIIFHDNLIHGGAITKGRLTRISLEFTLLLPQSNGRLRQRA